MAITFNEVISADMFRYRGEEGRLSFYRTLLVPGFCYTYCLRKAQYHRGGNAFHNRILGKVWTLLLRHYMYKFGFIIPASTTIGSGLYIGHFGHIVINGNAQIGHNVNISPGTVIGVTAAASSFSKPGVPTIGNRVWIGSNAVIVGKIVIGDDVLIAPGAFVYFDVPEKSVVRGNPGKILQDGIGSRDYINRIKE